MTVTIGFVTLRQLALFGTSPNIQREARILWADALLLRGDGRDPVPLAHAAGSRGESS